jgi:hypothetical protein
MNHASILSHTSKAYIQKYEYVHECNADMHSLPNLQSGRAKQLTTSGIPFHIPLRVKQESRNLGPSRSYAARQQQQQQQQPSWRRQQQRR